MDMLQEETADQFSFEVATGCRGSEDSIANRQDMPDAEGDQCLGQLIWNVASVASMLCETPLAMVSQLQGRFDCSSAGLLSTTGADLPGEDTGVRRQWWRLADGQELICSNVDFSLCESSVCTPDRITEISGPSVGCCFERRGLARGQGGLRYYAAMPMRNARGDLLGTLCVLDRQPRLLGAHQRSGLRLLAHQFITQLELYRDLRLLRRQTLTDPLTKVGNRRGLERRLREECARQLRNGEPFSLLMIDVDGFKQYNDTYGHPAGDVALRLLCELVRTPLRTSDYIARIGGDEFVVVLPNTSEAGAYLVAERIRATLRMAQWPHCPLSISTGVATLPAGEICDVGALLQIADQTMYSSKRRRRQQC